MNTEPTGEKMADYIKEMMSNKDIQKRQSMSHKEVAAAMDKTWDELVGNDLKEMQKQKSVDRAAGSSMQLAMNSRMLQMADKLNGYSRISSPSGLMNLFPGLGRKR
jgi:hypothetical protein